MSQSILAQLAVIHAQTLANAQLLNKEDSSVNVPMDGKDRPAKSILMIVLKIHAFSELTAQI